MAELVSMRIAYGQALVELGKANPDVVVLSADVSNSDHSYMFEEVFPDRFFNCGVQEQDMLSVAAGMALEGLVPFATTFGVFATARAGELGSLFFSGLPPEVAIGDEPGLHVDRCALLGEGSR